MRLPCVSAWERKWLRFSLSRVMIGVAVIAVCLQMPSCLEFAGVPFPWQYSWKHYWSTKALRDAWNGPVTIRVTPQDDLEAVLARFQAATVRTRVKHGLSIVVDPGGVREAGQSLNSPLGVDFKAKDMPAREFLDRVLKPLALTCKFQDWTVIVTSLKSADEGVWYGDDHGETHCGHPDGEWLRIDYKVPGWHLAPR